MRRTKDYRAGGAGLFSDTIEPGPMCPPGRFLRPGGLYRVMYEADRGTGELVFRV